MEMQIERERGSEMLIDFPASSPTVAMGYRRVEWVVLDWNTNAIEFYEEMGANVMQEGKVCRLTGNALQAYATTSSTKDLDFI